MGISSSLYSGVSGLNANGNAMSVIGNNIANANTIGFKSSRAIFGDLLSSEISGSGGTSQVGRGVGLSIVDNVFSQGTFENTETNTDMAIEGSGFFIVSDSVTSSSSNLYTRAGAFRFDSDGYMVNPEGYYVMGYNLDDDGNTYGDLEPVWANTQSFTQSGATENIDLNTNIDSDSSVIGTYPSFDITDPSGTSNYASSIQVYDSIGSTHLMTTYFTKNSNQNWEWSMTVDGGELNGGTSGELAIVGKGSLEFDGSGNLITLGVAADATSAPTTYELYSTPGDTSSDAVDPRPTATTFANALLWDNDSVQTQQIAIDMQTSQYASDSVVVSQEQDGYGTGTLVQLSVDEDGNVIGNFSNGTPRNLMRLALAKFTNPNALAKAGSNMYSESNGSGVPVIGTVGSGVGSLFTNSLELSNVDIAQEFVKMITTQRGFSANSKTITTTDEMLSEVINMKR